MSHCYVRCIFMIFQAHKIELEALYAELEKQARMASAGDDDGATVAAASASAAAKPSSSASSSSASASATLEDDEDVSSFFSYSCMTEYSNYFYVYYYFICGSRMICSQAAPHQLQVLLTRPQSWSLARAKVRATVRVPALTSRRMLHRSQWTRTRRRFVT